MLDGNMAPDKAFEVTAKLTNRNVDAMQVELLQQDGNGEWVPLGRQMVAQGIYTVQLRGASISSNPLKLQFKTTAGPNKIFDVGPYELATTDVVIGSVVVNECSETDFGRDYRFGYNGQHKDNELKRVGNSLDLGARIYDSRLGKMLSTDPREAEYPWQSPYAYFANSPIVQVDFNGEGDYYHKNGTHLGNDGKKDNLTYTATGSREVEILDKDGKGTGKFETKFDNAEKLDILHSVFLKQAATIYGESSAYRTNGMTEELKKEMFAIAYVHKRNKLAYGANSDAAEAFTATPIDKRNGTKMQLANAAVINVVQEDLTIVMELLSGMVLSKQAFLIRIKDIAQVVGSYTRILWDGKLVMSTMQSGEILRNKINIASLLLKEV